MHKEGSEWGLYLTILRLKSQTFIPVHVAVSTTSTLCFDITTVLLEQA